LATLAALLWLIVLLVWRGLAHLDWDFLAGYPSRLASRAGVLPAIIGTFWIGVISLLVTLPVGIAAAVYLNEFARPGRLTLLLRAGIANLAGVPSIVFGILGLAFFVRALALGKSLLAASLTLALLTLPIIIVVAEEALKTVPRSVREAAFALGASRWQVVRHHVLPYSMPGMLTGSILALSRSMGETAPLILVGAAAYLSFLPTSPLDAFTALPIQSYYWAQESRTEFRDLVWGAILLLLILTFLGNLAAILLRDRYQRRYRW
jgi:phosphate transport system permease protein